MESMEYVYIGKPVYRVKDWGRNPSTMDVGCFYGGDLKGVGDDRLYYFPPEDGGFRSIQEDQGFYVNERGNVVVVSLNTSSRRDTWVPRSSRSSPPPRCRFPSSIRE